MDCNLRRQWRNQHYQSEHLASAKIPRLFHEGPSATSTALPLFIPKMSAFPDSTTTPPPRFAKMGSGLFSAGQWQELELQALIFKYMLAGAAVPAELIHSIKKSLLINSPDQHLLHPVMQSGYWGRAFVDPEPGRCRRTDGKKWRCSRDVVGGHKYCERHVHRGRNRSRKHVEAQPTQSIVALESQSSNSLVSAAALPLTNNLHLNQRSLKSEPGGNEDLLDNHHHDNALNDGKHQGPQVLRHFFDDWPKSQQQPNASPRLTMSISQADQSSNFFLKLSTSSGEDNCGAEQAHRLNWEAGWNPHSMGGPLAEALRSSTSGSPISVLHELPSGCRSQTSSAST